MKVLRIKDTTAIIVNNITRIEIKEKALKILLVDGNTTTIVYDTEADVKYEFEKICNFISEDYIGVNG